MDDTGNTFVLAARRWILPSVRGMAHGLLLLVLSLLNIPLFVLTIVSLALIPVLGLGFAVFPLVVWLTRARTNVERGLSRWAGVQVARPYRPLPDGAGFGTWKRFRATVGDPATWLDVSWLIPGAVTGIACGVLAFAVPVYGLEGTLLIPVVLYHTIDWYGYGIFWPMDNIFEAWLSIPQGVILLAAGLVGARWLLWIHSTFASYFLRPTRSAALTQRVQHLTETRADTVDAQAAELRRIERDLHDGAQARLVSLSMSIGLAEELMKRDPAAAQRLLAEARESSGQALVELRDLVRGIHPPVLAERGLGGAVEALALSLPVPVAVLVDVPGRPDTPVESAAYFAVAEVLTNISKHSTARTAWVTMRYADGILVTEIGDDGDGGADPEAGTGLRGIRRRLAAFDGTMMVSSPPGGPTVVTMELPCALSSPRTTPSSGTD